MTTFEKQQLKDAKKQHKASKGTTAFEQDNKDLKSSVMKWINNNPPYWGSLKLSF